MKPKCKHCQGLQGRVLQLEKENRELKVQLGKEIEISTHYRTEWQELIAAIKEV